MEATAERVTMRSHPDEPRRIECPACKALVIRLKMHGQRILVEAREEPAEGAEPGLVVALDAFGEARPLRLPTLERAHGEALHRPHIGCAKAGK